MKGAGLSRAVAQRRARAQGASQRGAPGVAATEPSQVPGLLAPYCAVLDSCVVRALPAGPSVDELVAIGEAAVTLRA
jgi:hypothetical protein